MHNLRYRVFGSYEFRPQADFTLPQIRYARLTDCIKFDTLKFVF